MSEAAELRARAAWWAREVAADQTSLFVDTETSGLGAAAEICDIAIVRVDGAVLLDTLVRPARPTPIEASNIHGITDADVADARSWSDVSPIVADILGAARHIAIYNLGFDLPIINQCNVASGFPVLRQDRRWTCAMLAYADFDGTMATRRVLRHGRWTFDRSPRWWKLGEAAAAMGIENPGAHRALADAETTRRLVLAMAGQAVPKAEAPLQQTSLFGSRT